MWWPFIHKTPPRRQIDPIECGAVCLGIIFQSFGRTIRNRKLREKANTSRSGSDAASLIEAARYFGFKAFAKKVSTEDLKTMKKPAILFVDAGHFVVFEGYFFHRFFINDPASGRYSLTRNEMRKRLSNVAILIFPDEETKKSEFSRVVQFFRNSFRTSESHQFFLQAKDRRQKLFFQLSILALGLCAGLLVVTMASSIGFLLSVKSDDLYRFMLIGANALQFVLVLISFFIAWRAIMNEALERSRRETEYLIMGLHRVPYSFFDDVPFNIFARIFADSIKRSLIETHKFFVLFIFSFVFIQLIVQILIAWPFALLWLLFFTIFICQSILKKSHEDQMKVYDLAFNDVLDHRNAGRLMGQEKNLIEGYIKKEFNNFVNHDLIVYRPKLMLSPIIPVAILLFSFCIFSKNAWLGGTLSFEELLSLLVLYFTQTAAVFLAKKPRLRNREASSLLFELKDTGKKIIEETHDPSTLRLIKLDKVSFAYRGERKTVFEKIDLDIERGAIIGIVAAPLLGTTTLLHLIAGKIHPTSGKIVHFVESRPLRSAVIDEDSEPFLGTLKDNVTLFSPHITEQKIVWALEKARATDIFYNRPLGLLANIFLGGKNLSVQERKRLLLAQALAHDPDFLVLDEFFEFLDEECARLIIENLRTLKITTVFSSYRINDLEKTDQIVWIKDPHTLIIRRHRELLVEDLLYRRLVVQTLEGKNHDPST